MSGASPDSKTKVWGGESVFVSPEPSDAMLAEQAEDIPLQVVFEDDTLIVIDKPVGLVVHPGSGNWSGTLLNALLYRSPVFRELPRAGIVHRLDKDTSGLLVVAKTLEAQTDLVRQLQARTVKRHYLALVHGDPAFGGEVNAPIGRHPRDRLKMAVVGTGKPAITHYRVRERFRFHTLLQCKLETGRTHQIRIHLAAIGLPILGDPLYAPDDVVAMVVEASFDPEIPSMNDLPRGLDAARARQHESPSHVLDHAHPRTCLHP